MTLNQLCYFQSVARHQHFRRAAAELNLSQPSLSRSIALLEEELKIRLFERSGRNVHLTKYGEIFLAHAERILNDVAASRGEMHQLAGGDGQVDIAYVFPLADSYIPRTVRRFLSQEGNERVAFSFHQSYTQEMMAGLKAGRYDVIFGSYVEDEPDLEFIPVIRQELVIITPPDHPLTRQQAVSLRDLQDYPVIGYERNSGLGKFTRKIFGSHGLQPNIICESPDENAISALVAENFGIALIANVEQLKNRPVQVLALTGTSLEHTVYMAYTKNHYTVYAVEKFIRFIQDQRTRL